MSLVGKSSKAVYLWHIYMYISAIYLCLKKMYVCIMYILYLWHLHPQMSYLKQPTYILDEKNLIFNSSIAKRPNLHICPQVHEFRPSQLRICRPAPFHPQFCSHFYLQFRVMAANPPPRLRNGKTNVHTFRTILNIRKKILLRRNFYRYFF